MSREQLDEVANLDAEEETFEVWLLYPRGTYSGRGAEIHTAESLATRLLDGDVLNAGPETTPLVELWTLSTDEDGLAPSWSLLDSSEER